MRTATKGKQAVTAMIDLALNGVDGPVALSAISRRQGMSLSYLEQLFAKLRRSGLVQSIRGAGGGYVIARPVEGITVADIVVSVDAQPGFDPDDDERREGRGGGCFDTSELWRAANARMMELMRAVTLESLVAEQTAMGVPRAAAQLAKGIFPKPVVRPLRTTAPNSVFALGTPSVRP